jgi:hypothetical protein
MAASWNHHKVLFWSSHGHLHRSFQQQKIRRFPTQHQGGEYPNFSAYPHIRIFNNTPERVKNTGIVAERPTVRHLIRDICTHCALVKLPNGACTRGRHPSLQHTSSNVDGLPTYAPIRFSAPLAINGAASFSTLRRMGLAGVASITMPITPQWTHPGPINLFRAQLGYQRHHVGYVLQGLILRRVREPIAFTAPQDINVYNPPALLGRRRQLIEVAPIAHLIMHA